MKAITGFVDRGYIVVDDDDIDKFKGIMIGTREDVQIYCDECNAVFESKLYILQSVSVFGVKVPEWEKTTHLDSTGLA